MPLVQCHPLKLYDMNAIHTEHIMETAPCETGPFNPHLYSKKGIEGVKKK